MSEITTEQTEQAEHAVHHADGSTADIFPVPVGCPLCKSAMLAAGQDITCSPCEKTFGHSMGFPDLIIGDRFDDDSSDELLCNEEQNTIHTIENYWLPKFTSLVPNKDTPSKILSLGCGAGMEIDQLRDSGFNAVGIDNGNRTRVWTRRSHKDALFMANGMHLPFEDNTFDAAFCGCVFPHVGVQGDTFKVRDDYWEQRLNVAREMTRVVRPGGTIIVSSPNRLFPLDLFHGRAIGTYKTPINPPWRKFLLSKGDYARLFREAGCTGPANAESIKGYWGFCRTKNSLKGRLVSLPVKAMFSLGSNGLTPFLRASPLLPWIVVRITK